ncbi:MAG: hypothetical protein QXW97_01330 [Candidatus Pacearchaeota archaeon]
MTINKILTQEQKNRKIRRNQLLIGGFLILIMVFATAGYSLMSGNKSDTDIGKKIKYNGVVFTLNSNFYWEFNKNGINFATQFNPNEVKDVKIYLTGFNPQSYREKVLYTAGEPDNFDLLININQLVLNGFIKRHSRACLSTEDCTENAPVKNCNEDNIIILREAKKNEEERIYNEGNCVYIISSYANQTKSVDAFIFKFLEI